MNKKILTTILSALLHLAICTVFAVAVWFMIKYSTYIPSTPQAAESSAALLNNIWC